MANQPVVLNTTQGLVELDPAAVIGLREVVLTQTNRETGDTRQVPGVEVLTLGGYQGIAVVGTRDEVRRMIRGGGSGLLVPQLLPRG